MKSKALSEAMEKLGDENPAVILEGIREIGSLREEVTEDERYEVLSHLFDFYYIDTFDYPELKEIVDAAVDCIISFGAQGVPYLLSQIAGTDVKAQILLAVTMGRIGKGSYDHLMEFYRNQKDESARTFVLYAIGKIKDECVSGAIPEVLECIESENKELRDTAVRCIGKIAETVDSGKVDSKMRERMFQGVFSCIDDGYSGVRSKAARALGKLCRFGFLNHDHKVKAKLALSRLAGEDEKYAWDRAHIVRREAKLSLKYFD